MSTKKGITYGALFGAVIVPLSILGLVNNFIEVYIQPFIIVPRFLVNTLIDSSTAPGILSIGLLWVMSIGVYALFGLGLSLVARIAGLIAIIGIIILYYLALAFFGVSSITYS